MDVEAIRRIAADSLALKQRFFETSAPLLLEAGQRLSACLKSGGKVLTFGNGGSAADAQHLAGELVGRFRRDRAGLPALALTTDPSIITAVGNDLGYDQVFRRQVEAHGRRGDAAVGISTSGSSPNVVEALVLARARVAPASGLHRRWRRPSRLSRRRADRRAEPGRPAHPGSARDGGAHPLRDRRRGRRRLMAQPARRKAKPGPRPLALDGVTTYP